jgi:hypothetical protein
MTTTIGSRDWVIDAQDSLQGENISSDQRSTMMPILIQGKKLSQLICFIWTNEDPETAQELDKIFKSGQDELLKKLLFAHSGEPTPEYKLMLKVFKAEDLPIFVSEDKELFKIKVVVDKYQGGLSDPTTSEPSTLTIPYPPCPQIVNDIDVPSSGSAPIKKSELKDWMNQSPNDKPFAPTNPYIPTTCS